MRSNCGGEYISKEFNTFCEKDGIQRDFTATHTPQHNGLLERHYNTLVKIVLAMLSHVALSKVF